MRSKVLLLASTLLSPLAMPVAHAQAAFYVAQPRGGGLIMNGSDSNPGTLAAPFATLGKAQTAMQNSSTKLTYVRAGTYHLTSRGPGCDGGPSEALEFNPIDSGETFSYYPADGLASAILDGGSTSPTTGVNAGFCINGGLTSKVSFIGLQMQNFTSYPIYADSTVSITNNTLHDTHTVAGFAAGAILAGNSPGDVFNNNYVYNTQGNGVSLLASQGKSVSGSTIKGNVFINTCMGVNDCSAIYRDDTATSSPSTGVLIENNYVRDVHASGGGIFNTGGGVGIYLDDGASNTTVSGNVVTGLANVGVQIHGGSTNHVLDNIFDESTGNPVIVFYQGESGFAGSPMTGNQFEHNIVVANNASGGQGYNNDSPPNPLTITDNIYWNYGGSTVVRTGDTHAVYANPDITGLSDVSGWGALVENGSPAFLAPISFPATTAHQWGPPLFAIPAAGTKPSWTP